MVKYSDLVVDVGQSCFGSQLLAPLQGSVGEIPLFRWITTVLRILSPWEVCAYPGTEGTLRLYVMGVLGILEDVKEESPAQANDISKGLGTWGPGSVPRNSSLVLSHKAFFLLFLC